MILTWFGWAFFSTSRSNLPGKEFRYFPDAEVAAESQAENLETARIGHGRPRPIHEPVDPARFFYHFLARREMQMIRIRNEDLRVRPHDLIAS